MNITAVRPTPIRRWAARPYVLPLIAVLGLLLLAGTLLLSVFVGANTLSAAQVWSALTGSGGAEARFVVWDQRIPRTLAGLVVGAALGVAGALMQAFTRNALADPGILGVNAGAALCVAAGIAFLGISSPSGYMWLAFAGALAATLAVYVLGGGGDLRTPPARLAVTGVAFGAVLAGTTTGIALTHPDAFDRMRGWSAGSLLGRDTDVVMPVLPFLLLALLAALLTAANLNAMALGPDMAQSQGVSLARTRIVVLSCVTLLAGGATAIAGPMVFVGLVVPHLVRWTVGTDQRWILAGSVLAGSVLVLLADVLGRIAVRPSEMPAGIVTALVGAPMMIALARQRKATGL